MSEEINWSSFDSALRTLGPATLEDVPEVFQNVISDWATDTDSFYSKAIEDCLHKNWHRSPEEAVQIALDMWARNVVTYCRAVVGADSLFPFDSMGVSIDERQEWREAASRIRVRYDDDVIAKLVTAAQMLSEE